MSVERILETPRLILRPMVFEDVDDLLLVFGDPKVMASFGEQPFARPSMERWVERNLEHQRRYGYGLFSAVLKATSEVIGDCGLEIMEETESIAELGYDFRSAFWNQGLATEAATAVRDYAFGELGLPRLISLIRHGNNASRRVAEKLGMRVRQESRRGGAAYWVFAIERRQPEILDE